MKRITLFLLSICLLTLTNAQKITLVRRTLKKVMEVVMPEGGGSNGGSVAYNPIAKKYYIPMVGNANYPMAIFDLKGKELTSANAGNDLRGFWYNPKTKQLQGNCYDSGGWVKYNLDAKGDITKDDDYFKSEFIFENEMHQPDNQAVGFFSSQDNMVYFLTKWGSVWLYDNKGNKKKFLDLKNSKDAADPIEFGDDDSDVSDDVTFTYNTTSLIYTGNPGAEIGLLNVEDKRIEFFNKATGIFATEWQLPTDAVVYKNFNFTYANGMVWLFDKENRKWVVYK
jgi:hypothetical protein